MPTTLIVAATDIELCGADGLACGVGPVEASAATARALALRPFDAVLHVGLAGGRGLDPGTVVIGTEAVYCDLEAEWPVVDRVEADPWLVAAALEAARGAVSMPIHTSATVGQARDTVLQGRLVEAMEGFGVLRAAALAGVPAVELRVISNEVGEADRSRWRISAALEVLARVMRDVADAVDRTPVRARGS